MQFLKFLNSKTAFFFIKKRKRWNLRQYGFDFIAGNCCEFYSKYDDLFPTKVSILEKRIEQKRSSTTIRKMLRCHLNLITFSGVFSVTFLFLSFEITVNAFHAVKNRNASEINGICKRIALLSNKRLRFKTLCYHAKALYRNENLDNNKQ